MSELYKKDILLKPVDSNTENHQNIENSGNRRNPKKVTDKLINITGMKHVTDGRNIKKTMKLDWTEKKIVNTGSPVEKILTDEEITKNRKIPPINKRYPDVNKNEAKRSREQIENWKLL